MISQQLVEKAKKLRVFFQHEDAKRDKNISNYFVETISFGKAELNESGILEGKYGTGKTAIIEKLKKNQSEEVFAFHIDFDTSQIFEELMSNSNSDDFATICESMIYIILIYEIATGKYGKLASSTEGALIKELKDLELAPYSDLISRIAESTIDTVKRVESVEFFNTIGVSFREIDDKKEINIRRYRSFNSKVTNLIKKMYKNKSVFITIDSIVPNKNNLKDIEIFVYHLNKWFLKNNLGIKLLFYINVPKRILELNKTNGRHYEAQDMFIDCSCTELELKNIVYERISQALDVRREEADNILKTEFNFDINLLKDLSFNRSRDYIKFFNKYFTNICLEVCDNISDIKEATIIQYADEVVSHLEPEWVLYYSHFYELKEMMNKVDNLTLDQLNKLINDYRSHRKLLNTTPLSKVVVILKDWKLININDEGLYNCHKLFKYAKLKN